MRPFVDLEAVAEQRLLRREDDKATDVSALARRPRGNPNLSGAPFPPCPLDDAWDAQQRGDHHDGLELGFLNSNPLRLLCCWTSRDRSLFSSDHTKVTG